MFFYVSVDYNEEVEKWELTKNLKISNDIERYENKRIME